MYDVTGVNVFPRKLMKFPRKEKVNSVPYRLLSFKHKTSPLRVDLLSSWSVEVPF